MSTSVTKAKTFAEFWDSIPAWVKLVLIIIVLIIVWRIAKAIKDKLKQDKLQNLIQDNTVTVTSTVGTTPVVQTVDLGTKASAIDQAIYHYYGGMAENEDVMVTELLGVPKVLIPQLSEVYYKLNGHNLKQDYQSFLSTDDYNKVIQLFQ